MFFDALTAFFAVLAWLTVTVAVLWAISKLLGYVLMVIEGEHLVPEIKREMTMTARRVRRWRSRGAPTRPLGRAHPSA